MLYKDFADSKTNAELQQFGVELTNWLQVYTMPVIRHAISQIDAIVSSETALDLIHQLYIRTIDVNKSQVTDLMFLLLHPECDDFDIHNHPLEHPQAYRDVLYDMFLKDYTRGQ